MKIRTRNPAVIFFLYFLNILRKLRQPFCCFSYIQKRRLVFFWWISRQPFYHFRVLPRQDHRQTTLTGNPVHTFIQRRPLHTDKTNHTGIHQPLVQLTTHPAIHHNNLTPGTGKADIISILHIQKRRAQPLTRSIPTSSIPRHHIFLLIRLHNLKHSPVNPESPKRKLLHPALSPKTIQSIPDQLRRFHFPIRTRFPDKIKPRQKLHLPLAADFPCIHKPHNLSK